MPKSEKLAFRPVSLALVGVSANYRAQLVSIMKIEGGGSFVVMLGVN